MTFRRLTDEEHAAVRGLLGRREYQPALQNAVLRLMQNYQDTEVEQAEDAAARAYPRSIPGFGPVGSAVDL
jgi:hypothetical protein